MNYSVYYQAFVKKELCWQLTALLRSHEHLAFDRTIDTQSSRFEFFVSPDLEDYFLELMQRFIAQGIVWDLVKLPNRLEHEEVNPLQNTSSP